MPIWDDKHERRIMKLLGTLLNILSNSININWRISMLLTLYTQDRFITSFKLTDIQKRSSNACISLNIVRAFALTING